MGDTSHVLGTLGSKLQQEIQPYFCGSQEGNWRQHPACNTERDPKPINLNAYFRTDRFFSLSGQYLEYLPTYESDQYLFCGPFKEDAILANSAGYCKELSGESIQELTAVIDDLSAAARNEKPIAEIRIPSENEIVGIIEKTTHMPELDARFREMAKMFKREFHAIKGLIEKNDPKFQPEIQDRLSKLRQAVKQICIVDDVVGLKRTNRDCTEVVERYRKTKDDLGWFWAKILGIPMTVLGLYVTGVLRRFVNNFRMAWKLARSNIDAQGNPKKPSGRIMSFVKGIWRGIRVWDKSLPENTAPLPETTTDTDGTVYDDYPVEEGDGAYSDPLDSTTVYDQASDMSAAPATDRDVAIAQLTEQNLMAHDDARIGGETIERLAQHLGSAFNPEFGYTIARLKEIISPEALDTIVRDRLQKSANLEDAYTQEAIARTLDRAAIGDHAQAQLFGRVLRDQGIREAYRASVDRVERRFIEEVMPAAINAIPKIVSLIEQGQKEQARARLEELFAQTRQYLTKLAALSTIRQSVSSSITTSVNRLFPPTDEEIAALDAMSASERPNVPHHQSIPESYRENLQAWEEIINESRGFGHDIQNILSAFLGYLEVATRGTPIEKWKTELNKLRNLDPRLLASNVELATRLSNANAAESNIDLRVNIDGIGEIVIPQEKQYALLRIVYELIANAIKYADTDNAEKGALFVSVDIARTDRAYQITVEDNGIGIIKTGDVFQPNFRERRKKNVRGDGLGLYNVAHLTQEQGWQIELKSTFGKGSTFALSLPDETLKLNNPDGSESSGGTPVSSNGNTPVSDPTGGMQSQAFDALDATAGGIVTMVGGEPLVIPTHEAIDQGAVFMVNEDYDAAMMPTDPMLDPMMGMEIGTETAVGVSPEMFAPGLGAAALMP